MKTQNSTLSKFHQSYKYFDVKMGATVEMNISIINGNVVGKLKVSHPIFPIVTSLFNGLKPTEMNTLENRLKEDQSKNNIRDLVFGKEMCVSDVNDKCVEVSIN